MTTPLRYSDPCALPPFEEVHAKAAALGFLDTGFVDRLFALDAENVRETQLHLTRFEVLMIATADLSGEKVASMEPLLVFLTGMTAADMLADYKKTNGRSLADTFSKHTCKNC